MSYDLVYTQRAVRDIEKLDPKIKKRLGKVLIRYKVKLISMPSHTRSRWFKSITAHQKIRRLSLLKDWLFSRYMIDKGNNIFDWQGGNFFIHRVNVFPRVNDP